MKIYGYPINFFRALMIKNFHFHPDIGKHRLQPAELSNCILQHPSIYPENKSLIYMSPYFPDFSEASDGSDIKANEPARWSGAGLMDYGWVTCMESEHPKTKRIW